ncbi:MAG: hypothetical protein ABJA85_05990, partial [Bacteroidota bacterium]
MKVNRSITLKNRLSPYLVIAIAAILAYLPLSSMLFTLRNDVLAIEYPIQHFMSDSLRNGEFPTWFNTWSMGFPLQSILTWGVYSTPRMLTGFLFESNIYLLQAEFLFFIMASGWCMFKLIKSHFLTDRNLSLLLACCFMLSGFTVGSSQWLLYITSMTFIPLSIHFLLSLLKKPSIKYVFLFAVSYYLLFTNVHIYLTVIYTYVLFFFLAVYLIGLLYKKSTSKGEKLKLFKHISLALFFTGILCAAPVYYSLETIAYLERSLPLAGNSSFFQSNYLHPDALTSFLLPLSAVKTNHFNTEGTVLDVYIGLLPLLLFPTSFLLNLKQKNNKVWGLLLTSLIFLFISFGHLTPLRGWLNILPGMDHFRHPGVLRVFFNFAFILYLAASFKGYQLTDLFMQGSKEKKNIIISIVSLLLLSLVIFFFYAENLTEIWKGSFYLTIKNINKNELILLSATLQIFFTAALLFCTLKKQQFFALVIITELIINTFICTPFFTISTYRANEVAKILQPVKGFPVQQNLPSDVPATITDLRNNSWHNINTYRKEVSNNVSMPGPLILEKVLFFLDSDSL